MGPYGLGVSPPSKFDKLFKMAPREFCRYFWGGGSLQDHISPLFWHLWIKSFVVVVVERCNGQGVVAGGAVCCCR